MADHHLDRGGGKESAEKEPGVEALCGVYVDAGFVKTSRAVCACLVAVGSAGAMLLLARHR